VDNVEVEKDYNQFDEVPFCVDTTGINTLKQTYIIAMRFPTRTLMVKENLFMYRSCLHIFYVLL
jgi:hypothetical protein